MMVFKTVNSMFQHTAARRRLAPPCLPLSGVVACFNTQPPEGGWAWISRLSVTGYGFNTQPPEGGWFFMVLSFPDNKSFNTQPPEGGWVIRRGILSDGVGFNTQPPEGGWGSVDAGVAFEDGRFQHTAARRRLEPLSKASLHQVSQPQFR